MLQRLLAAAVAAFIFAAPAFARDDRDSMLPRYSKLLTKLYGLKGKSCPNALYRDSLEDMFPSFWLRKNKDSEKEFTIVRFYPMAGGIVTLEVHTESRFENNCRQAGVSLSAKDGAMGSGGFSECPGKGDDDMVDAYGYQDKKPFGTEFAPAWKKRAEEYLSEVESIAAMCN